MEVSDVTTVRAFDDDGFEKVNLFETERFFADVYCFEAGQAQELHEHAGSDKVYHVLEGEAEVTVGDESMTVGAGDAVLAEAGKKHGVEARERTRMLVFMAPHPAHVDENHGHEHGHGHQHGHAEHEHDESSFDFGFVTVSSSRDEEEDRSGEKARELVEDDGHSFAEYRVVTDDADKIRDAVETLVPDCDAVVTSGGTGLTDDDVTVETVRPLFDKEIEGFGEEFRRRSVEEIGTAAILSRATAGVVGDCVVFVLPGSVGAVETGMRLALGEVRHVLGLVRR
ncbi:MAG: molybdenum cofactor synthesis domain-containing protein [Halobacteriales archaeon]|nr:molybdenum cofactor synthesis domain-containing protein [Halobacteriales archaeon]